MHKCRRSSAPERQVLQLRVPVCAQQHPLRRRSPRTKPGSPLYGPPRARPRANPPPPTIQAVQAEDAPPERLLASPAASQCPLRHVRDRHAGPITSIEPLGARRSLPIQPHQQQPGHAVTLQRPHHQRTRKFVRRGRAPEGACAESEPGGCL